MLLVEGTLRSVGAAVCVSAGARATPSARAVFLKEINCLPIIYSTTIVIDHNLRKDVLSRYQDQLEKTTLPSASRLKDAHVKRTSDSEGVGFRTGTAGALEDSYGN